MGETKTEMNFSRPASIDGTVPKQAEGDLEEARKILRGVHRGLVCLRRNSGVVWDSPVVNFGLLILIEQFELGLAALEEVGRS